MGYEKFASVYDIMMQDVPYEQWANYLEAIMVKYDAVPEMILDLGCGTGTMTQLLAEKGYETIGVDLSEDMLITAKEKAHKSNLDILYLCQDMTCFELYGTVGCVVSVCDSLNYITEEEQLLQVFKLVNNYLEPGGLFIFDLNTVYKFKEVLGDNTFAQAYEKCAYIWDNYYYDEEKMNEYNLTIFIEENNKYSRYEELHYEKAYSIETIKSLLKSAGLKVEAIYDDNTFDEEVATSERIYFVAREQLKEKQSEGLHN